MAFKPYTWEECEADLRKENPEFWARVDACHEVDFFEDLTRWQKFVADVKARVSIFFHNLMRK